MSPLVLNILGYSTPLFILVVAGCVVYWGTPRTDRFLRRSERARKKQRKYLRKATENESLANAYEQIALDLRKQHKARNEPFFD